MAQTLQLSKNLGKHCGTKPNLWVESEGESSKPSPSCLTSLNVSLFRPKIEAEESKSWFF